jgi:hypothetical protein
LKNSLWNQEEENLRDFFEENHKNKEDPFIILNVLDKLEPKFPSLLVENAVIDWLYYTANHEKFLKSN